MIHTWYVCPLVVPTWYEVTVVIYGFGYVYATVVHLRLGMRSSVERLDHSYSFTCSVPAAVRSYVYLRKMINAWYLYPLVQLVRGSSSSLRSLDGISFRGVPIIS